MLTEMAFVAAPYLGYVFGSAVFTGITASIASAVASNVALQATSMFYGETHHFDFKSLAISIATAGLVLGSAELEQMSAQQIGLAMMERFEVSIMGQAINGHVDFSLKGRR